VLKIGFEPEKIFLFSKNSILPLGIMGCFLVYFFCISDFSEGLYQSTHTLFLVITILTCILSIVFRIPCTAMSSVIVYVSYIVINGMRYSYGEDYMFSAGYNIWTMLLFPNLLIGYLFFQKKQRYKYWSLFLIFLFLETAIIEKIQNQTINADSYYFYKHIGMLNYPTLYLASVCLIILMIRQIIKGQILNAATLFSSISVLLGVYYSENLFAFTLFFLASATINCVTTISYAQYTTYKDEDFGIPNLKSFFRDSIKKYPLKYSIALIYIDDYSRLVKRFGESKTIVLKKMFINRIHKANPKVLIYNYKPDALILAFMNANATDSFEVADNIRRILAKSIFIFNENNHLQLTTSQCVSEFKRSDANALAVLGRAEESLQKACKFTRNITIKA